jgi:hypothetical protein
LDARKRKAIEFVLNLNVKKKQQTTFTAQNKLQEAPSWASFLVAYTTAKHNKLFSGSEFVKHCMVDVAGEDQPENK